MDWSLLFVPTVIAAGAYGAAEKFGKSRGKHSGKFKLAGVALSLVAGLALVVAMWQFGWVTSPPGWVAGTAGAVLLVQAAIALVDLSDGQADRGCRMAVLMLPLLLVLGGAWLVDNVPDTAEKGKDHVTSKLDER